MADEMRATLAELFAGRFSVHAPIPWGGLAPMYRVTSPGDESVLAVLPIDCETQPENTALFLEGIAPATRIRSPHIVPIRQADVRLGVPFVTYELAAGRTLQAQLDEGEELPPERTLAIGSALLEGLADVHAAGTYHGDLTPSNILLGEGGPRLLGVGIAPLLRTTRPRDVTGPTGRGSGPAAVRYLAPEVLGGGRGEARSDLFSVAAILSRLITGEAPGAGSAPPGAFDAVPGLRDLIERSMTRLPEDRHADAASMRAELRALKVLAEDQRPVRKDPTPLWEVLPRQPPPAPRRAPVERNWWYPVAGMLLISAAATAIWLGARTPGRKPEVATAPSPPELRAPPAKAEPGTQPEDEEATMAEAPADAEGEPPSPPSPSVQATSEPNAGALTGELPELLADFLARVESKERFETEDFRPLYGYIRQQPQDVRGQLVMARAYMANGWYTAAYERYEQALEVDAEAARNDPELLRDLIEIIQKGDDMLFYVWPLIERHVGRDALPAVEAALDDTTRWSETRQLERLEARLRRLEVESDG